MRGYTVRARIEKEGKEEVAKDLRMSSNEREKGLREREEGGSDRTRRGLSLFSITVPDTLFGGQLPRFPLIFAKEKNTCIYLLFFP